MILRAMQLQEKCEKQNVDLYMTFVDLTKAFDTVSLGGLWKFMAKFGCTASFIAKVRQFHDGMLTRSRTMESTPNRFLYYKRSHARLVLAPRLFSMIFSVMLTDAIQDCDDGFPIRYGFNGKLFNVRSLQANQRCRQVFLMSFSMQMT